MKKIFFVLSLYMLSLHIYGQQNPLLSSIQANGSVQHANVLPLVVQANAQDKCGLKQAQEEMKLLNPLYEKELLDFQNIVKYYSTKRSAARSSILSVPVVVHVIHLASEPVGTGRNISDAQVQAQLQVLNDDFNAQNANWSSGTPSVFQGVKANPEIQFCLVSRDQNGNVSNGITRHMYSDPTSANFIEDTIKNATYWNTSRFLNIWVLAIPGTTSFGGTLGYAYLPTGSIVGTSKDGIVMDYRWFGSPAMPNVSGACRSLTHEVGHYFGLEHIWGGSVGTVGSPHVCSDDDGISDTPLQLGPTSADTSFFCSSGNIPVSCSGVQNMFCDYMDYVNDDACFSTFSQGQVNVMRNVLQGISPIVINNNVYVGRSSLLTSQLTTCVPSYPIDASIGVHLSPSPNSIQCDTSTITPIVALRNFGTTPLTSATIYYTVNGLSPVSYNWIGNLATNASTNVTLPSFVPPVGSFVFKSFVSKPNGGVDPFPLNDTLQTTHQVILIKLSTSSTIAACGGSGGNVSVVATGSPYPYTYSWNTGSTASQLFFKPAGIYTVTVSSNGCSVTTSKAIAGTSAVTVSIAETPVTCTFSDGSANAIAGGDTSYYYTWSNGSHTPTISGLIAGIYSVTVNAHGCSASASQIISTNSVIKSTTSGTNTTCGLNNGSASVSATGGTSYTYLWSNGATTSTITGLISGSYIVTVSSNGCSVRDTQTINSSVGVNNISSAQRPATNCFANDGRASVFVNNGNTVYSYLWSNGDTSSFRNNVSTGVYYVTVTSANGCTAKFGCSVGVDSGLVLSFASTDATCNRTDGTATVNVVGGAAPYYYQWNTGATTKTITGLAAGFYSAYVTSGYCNAFYSVHVNGSTSIFGNYVSTSTTCGLNNGSAVISNMQGGTTYSFHWNNGDTTSTLSNLSPGSYSVTVTSNGCSVQYGDSIRKSDKLPLAAYSTNTGCNVNNGTAWVSSTAWGLGGYSFLWNTGDTTSMITGLLPGVYSVTATYRATGCSSVLTATVLGSISPVFTVEVDSALCGLNNGRANVISNGSALYRYLWSTGDTLPYADSLSPGNYTLTVTSNNCNEIYPFVVYEKGILSATVTSTPATTLNNGAAMVIATGGVSSVYNYSWSNGQTTQSANNLSAGTYSVTISDVNNCSIVKSVIVGSSIGIIDNIVDDGLNVYPNPFNDVLTIELSTRVKGNVSVELVNAVGQSIERKHFENTQTLTTHIETDCLASGVYYLRVETEKKREQYRLIKVK